MKPEIIHSTDFLSDAVALIEKEAAAAIEARGEFRIALSGGNTPRPVYETLASRGGDSLKNWIFTFGDERCVPPDSDQSNYRMAKESLFDRAGIPEENILRILGEEDPAVAAQKYEDALRARSGSELYRHDLLLLGMGDDGHTASLFPGTEALKVTDRWVVSNFVPKFNTHRVTMTYPLLDAARHVCFLVNSKGKDAILEEVFSGKSSYPSAAVAPANGRLTWLLGA